MKARASDHPRAGSSLEPKSTCPSGVSLLELLVATACTMLLAGAVFSLLVTCAIAGRRGWGEVAARTVARATVASVGEDLRVAGVGVEHADAIQHKGQRIPVAASGSTTLLRAVLPAGGVHEIWGHVGISTYIVEAAGAPPVGRLVAAVDQALRPPAEPLPVGTVVFTTPRGAFVELSLAWHASEAALLSAWGPPRAVVPLRVREYEVRSAGGALQLRRRDDGGSWQPIADGLDAFDLFWIVDTDADGVADARRRAWVGGLGSQACAVELEARVIPAATRLIGTGSPPVGGPAAARRWVRLGGC